MSDLILGIVGLLGLYDDRPNKVDEGEDATASPSTMAWWMALVVKLLFFITDFFSTALDWQIVFSLSRGKFKLVWADESEQANETVARWFTAVFVLIMILSHLIFLRGKWFYLHNKDWAAFSITEVVLYAIEDVAAILLYILVDGFYSNDRVVDKLNVLLSNFTGYIVVGILTYRMFQSPRPPCSAYIFPFLVLLLVAFVSLASYISLFAGSFEDAIDNNEFNAAVFYPLAAGSLGGLIFLYILVLVCKWDQCLRWTTPSEEEERETNDEQTDTEDEILAVSVNNNSRLRSGEQSEHNKTSFVIIWTIVFIGSIFLGRSLSEESKEVGDIENFRWLPSFDQSRLIGEGGATRLFFGHSVDWENEGDINGAGSSITIGAISEKYGNESNMYTSVSSLESQTSFWKEPSSPLSSLPSYVVAASVKGRVYGGFVTNETGTYGWVSLYASYRGPAVLNNTSPQHHVSVTIGGDSIKSFKTRFGKNTVVTDVNSVRRVGGFPYADQSRGFVQAAGPWQIRRCIYASSDCICQGGSNDCTVTNLVEELGNPIQGSFPGEEFGRQVSMAELNSSVLAIASTRRLETNNSGAVTIMYMPYASREGQTLTWSRMTRTSLSSGELDDQFAKSIAMSGNGQRLIVGAPKAIGGGAAYLYEYNENKWSLHTKLTPQIGNETREVQYYGYAVSIDGTGKRVAIAAETDDSSYVYTYENSDFQSSTWIAIGGIIGDGPAGNYAVGYENSLSLDYKGNFLAFGDIGVDESEGLGRVRIYKFTEQF